MKLLSTLAMGAIALMLASTASAQTKVYITGSTAFRSAAVTAINSVLQGTVTTASDNSSLTSANAVTWTGGNIGGTPVTIKASWSGSAAGIQTVAGSLPVRFLPDGATGTANADPRNTANPAESAVPDITMADNYQSSSLFNGTFNGVTYQNLTDEIVGVVTFRWVASNGFPANLNMTPQLAQALFSSGSLPLAMFTGNPADHDKKVFATGRDPDSGTRITAFAESGIGVNSVVRQFKPTTFADDPAVSGTDTSIVTAHQLYPVQTINGVSTQFAGNSGESSGSTLRGYLNRTLSSAVYGNGFTAGYYITYLGTSDANSVLTATTKPAVSLKYNGVDFSTTAVQEGQYTFWGYQHLMYRSGLSGVKASFANNLRDTLLGTSAATLAPNVKYGDMQVSRTGDGSVVGADYF